MLKQKLPQVVFARPICLVIRSDLARGTSDAQIAKGLLDEVGIESMIRSDNAGGMYPALSGADLLVRADDVEKANEALIGTRSRSDPSATRQ